MYDDPTAVSPAPATRRVLLFVLGGRRWAIPAPDVAGLADGGPTRAVPGAPEEVLGLVEWRGNVLTALDLPRLLDVETGGGPPCLVRLARPMQRVALSVPAALSMSEVPAEGPERTGDTPELAEGSFEHEGGRVWQIDPQRLIRHVERRMVGSL